MTLTKAQRRALEALAQPGIRSLGAYDLGHRTGSHRAIWRLIETLDGAGLVERNSELSGSHFGITDAGRAALEQGS